MNRRKITFGVFLSVFMVAIMMMGVSSASAISIKGGEKADLGDLFVLDNLFRGGTDNRILGTGNNGKSSLGNLFILDQLFNEDEAETPAVVTPAVAQPSLANQLAGRILIQVESKGEAWYVNPVTMKRVYLGTPAQAVNRMANVSLGISNADFDDISTAGVPNRLLGRVVIKTEDNGKLYYINPVNRNIVSVGGASEAANLINNVGLGITNADITKIAVSN